MVDPSLIKKVFEINEEVHCHKCGLIFHSVELFQEHIPNCNEHELTKEEKEKLAKRVELIHTKKFFYEKLEEKRDRALVDKYKEDVE